jgi:phospholipid/cholesterol/gamma-HCH transport system permease protein
MVKKIIEKAESYLGRNLKRKINGVIEFSGFFKVTLEETFILPYSREVGFIILLRQILFTGFEALSIITLVGLVIGGTIIIQGMSVFENFGQGDLFYNILILIITRELGPILTAFIIVARSGTSITTELGFMVVNHEVEALESIGILPVRYLVVPRVYAVIISLFCLNIYFNIAGLIGGYLVSLIVHSTPFSEFFNNLFKALTIRDIIITQLKSLIFGFLIAVISCYNGLKVKYASTEVPVRTIKSVVESLTWIFIFDIILVIIFYSV